MCMYYQPRLFLFVLVAVCLLLNQGCVSSPVDVYGKAQFYLRNKTNTDEWSLYKIGNEVLSPVEWALFIMADYGQSDDLSLLIPYLFDSELKIQLKAMIAYRNILQRMNYPSMKEGKHDYKP